MSPTRVPGWAKVRAAVDGHPLAVRVLREASTLGPELTKRRALEIACGLTVREHGRLDWDELLRRAQARGKR